jgi:pimeloyl-ACP methyl ester carboxylesterase
MATLDGTDTTHRLGDGIAIRAPGTVGTIVLHPAAETTAGTTPPTVITGDAEVDGVLGRLFPDRCRLDAALTTTSSATITVEPPAGGTVVLVVADPSPHGMITFHAPDGPPAAEALDADLAPARLTFTIRASRLAAAEAPGGMEDLGFPEPVERFITILWHDSADAAAQDAARWLAESWERRNRPYGIKELGLDRDGSASWSDFGMERWPELKGKEVLLLVHGIFSTVESGFGWLDRHPENDPVDRTPYQELRSRYDVIIGFDHPSVSVSPIDNAQHLADLVPGLPVPTVDVLCHSRGGLVARLLAGESPAVVGQTIEARTIVFAGTPNSGTVLVDPARLEHLVNRFVNLLRWLPPGPWGDAASDVEGFLHLVAFLGTNIEEGLPGLVYMTPENMAAHNRGTVPHGERHAFGANHEPTRLTRRLLDEVEDRAVFSGIPNDVAVPTDLVNEDAAPDLTVTGDIWHDTYFEDLEVRGQVLALLPGRTR